MTILIDESFDHVSIEGLRIAYSSCFSCGVCWFEEHVSLDCRECGGYALVRPCPSCDGRCGNKWTRNLQASHARQQAIWDGCCGREVTPTPVENILDIKRRSLPNVVMSSPVSNNSSSTTTATGNLSTTSQSSAKAILIAKQQSVVSVSWLIYYTIIPFWRIFNSSRLLSALSRTWMIWNGLFQQTILFLTICLNTTCIAHYS